MHPFDPALRRGAPARRYDGIAILLHWTTALLVVVVGTLGLLRNSWPTETSQTFWIDVHGVIGILLWFLIVVRLNWRLHHPPPERTGRTSPGKEALALWVHRGLYALLLLTPVVGLVTFIYHGRVLDLGFFAIRTGIMKDRAVFHPTQIVHIYLAYGLFALIGVHVAAALWHGLTRGDGFLGRMQPGPSPVFHDRW